MRRPWVAGFSGGLVLFVLSFVVLRIVKMPALGRWEILIAALGWIVILTAAAALTRGWLAPALVGAGGVLNMVGDRMAGQFLQQGSDRGIVFGALLEMAFNAISIILLGAGCVLMVRAAMRRLREKQPDGR